jgi:hypothetical protein
MHGGYSEISEDFPDGIGVWLLQLVPEILFLSIPLLDFALYVVLYGDWLREAVARLALASSHYLNTMVGSPF